MPAGWACSRLTQARSRSCRATPQGRVGLSRARAARQPGGVFQFTSAGACPAPVLCATDSPSWSQSTYSEHFPECSPRRVSVSLHHRVWGMAV